MSITASWLALASDWHLSEMFDGLGGPEMLAWIGILTHAKMTGRGGRFLLRRSRLCRDFHVDDAALGRMLVAATAAGALSIDGDVVTLLNWRGYQNPAERGNNTTTGGGKVAGFTKTVEFSKSETPPTSHPSPTTTHQPPDTAPLPPEGGKPSRRPAEKREEPEDIPIPPEMDTPEFRAAWADWLADKRARRQRMTPLAVLRAYARLGRMGPERAVTAINASIEGGWKGIHEPDGNFSGNGRAPKPDSGLARNAARLAERAATEYPQDDMTLPILGRVERGK